MALAIVLLSVVVIAVGPNLINGLTQDNEELKLKVTNQREMITDLNKRVNELNDEVLANQMACTNKFVTREKEILEMLTMMEGEASKTHNKVLSKKTQTSEPERLYMNRNEDTIGVVSMMVRPAEPSTTTVVVSDNSKMLKMLKGMKSNVEQHIKEKGSK